MASKLGSGKTELARYLASNLKKQGLEINLLDQDGESISTNGRLSAYRMYQSIAGRSSGVLIIYDEVEDVLSSASFAQHGFHGAGEITKGLLNDVLENNAVPAVWISNTLQRVDPAYLRRFDLIVELGELSRETRMRMTRRTLNGIPIGKDVIAALAGHSEVTPAHLGKVARILGLMNITDRGKADHIVRQVVDSDLIAAGKSALSFQTTQVTRPTPSLTYREDLINCDTRIDTLSRSLNQGSSARLCLFGPPGTGKSARAGSLAQKLERLLQVMNAADILDK